MEESYPFDDPLKTANLTREVRLTPQTSFLIRINGEECVLVMDRNTAILTVDSFAAHEVARYQSPSTKVFREDLREGLEVRISTRELGTFYHGPVKKRVTVDAVEVSHAMVVASRIPTIL